VASVFYLEVISMAIGIGVLYVSFWRIGSNPAHAASSLLRNGDAKMPRVDVEGWILLFLAATVPLVALTLGDDLLAWTHPIELLLLISGPILVCAFVLFEAKVAAAPIVDMTPVFNVQYLRVLFQVFGVITIYNSVCAPVHRKRQSV
jgi:UDP-N-acetylmuramyl pentapeptide phosphotransferase/UDP-N-acetylglucosamine-1-phosphate transferase